MPLDIASFGAAVNAHWNYNLMGAYCRKCQRTAFEVGKLNYPTNRRETSRLSPGVYASCTQSFGGFNESLVQILQGCRNSHVRKRHDEDRMPASDAKLCCDQSQSRKYKKESERKKQRQVRTAKRLRKRFVSRGARHTLTPRHIAPIDSGRFRRCEEFYGRGGNPQLGSTQASCRRR